MLTVGADGIVLAFFLWYLTFSSFPLFLWGLVGGGGGGERVVGWCDGVG